MTTLQTTRVLFHHYLPDEAVAVADCVDARAERERMRTVLAVVSCDSLTEDIIDGHCRSTFNGE